MAKKIISAAIALLCIIGLCFVNAYKANTNQIMARKETLSSAKIDDDIDGSLICFFSDLKYGAFIDRNFVDKTIKRINTFTPDLVLFGGDLIDDAFYGNLDEEDIEYLKAALKSIDSKYGKYAVLGDVDIRHQEIAEDILVSANFEILNNANIGINIDSNSSFNIVGIDASYCGSPDLESSFFGINDDTYTIAVSHCPDIFTPSLSYSYDYLLAGHSLGGQVYFPLISLFQRGPGCNEYFKGKISKNGKTMDITNGLGRINKNARFNADAEIVLYTLNNNH